MIRALVSLDVDLASSIALRYACQMAEMIEMELQPIHVEELGREGRLLGSGWVERTWERTLLKTGLEEINRLISTERGSCPAIFPPKISVGEPQNEILRELKEEPYDLLVKGELYAFTPNRFHEKVHSRLFRHAPCPIMVVNNLVHLRKVSLLLEEGTEIQPLIGTFLKLFGAADVDADLLYCRFRPSIRQAFRQNEEPDTLIRAAEEMLSQQGRRLGKTEVREEAPEKLGDLMRDYGLVMTSIHHDLGHKNPMAELLSHTPSPILLLIRQGVNR
jgi:nucleotide-binding universal stress UspA family protein